MTGVAQKARYVIVLIMGFLAGSHVVDAVQSWNAWRAGAAHDASSAGAFRAYFWQSLAIALVSLALAGLTWWLLRPKTSPGE